jgi:hypothetical protein
VDLLGKLIVFKKYSTFYGCPDLNEYNPLLLLILLPLLLFPILFLLLFLFFLSFFFFLFCFFLNGSTVQ